MSTQLLVRKLHREVATLRREVSVMKEVILGAVEDSEGAYRLTFVRKMSRRAKEPPRFRYRNPRLFLQQVHGAAK